ncbi:MAG: FKBP-type peptidyl-prolyl cis-trans isomerase [Acidobacteria bacterium]|nr:FKBP-type peptidyl-prolyl cis-trans isomerase [Acidobacteriota bacterium]
MRLAAIAAVLLLASCNSYKLPKAVPPLKGKLRTQYTMRVIDVQPGTGKPYEPGKLLKVHYTGYLRDGTKFDSSRDRNEPFQFEQGKRRVVAGFDNCCEGMRVGAKRRLLIPYQLAYGEKGREPRIPPKAELIFDIELLDVLEPPPAPLPVK